MDNFLTAQTDDTVQLEVVKLVIPIIESLGKVSFYFFWIIYLFLFVLKLTYSISNNILAVGCLNTS